MPLILFATAGLVEDGVGEMMRTYLLSLPFIPISLLRDFSFHFSPWAFLQIPVILGVSLGFIASHSEDHDGLLHATYCIAVYLHGSHTHNERFTWISDVMRVIQWSNKPHALNSAIAVWFQFEDHWRGVSDVGRYVSEC